MCANSTFNGSGSILQMYMDSKYYVKLPVLSNVTNDTKISITRIMKFIQIYHLYQYTVGKETPY